MYGCLRWQPGKSDLLICRSHDIGSHLYRSWRLVRRGERGLLRRHGLCHGFRRDDGLRVDRRCVRFLSPVSLTQTEQDPHKDRRLEKRIDKAQPDAGRVVVAI